MQVLEDLQRERPYGVLCNPREERVAQLVQYQGRQPEDAVGENDGQRNPKP